jgi:hypothetical protein
VTWSTLRRKAPMPRGEKRLRPKKRIKPVNRKRKARLLEVQFGPKGAWIRTLECATCWAPPPSDPSHATKTRGAGGTAEHLIPQCRPCHIELGLGAERFEALYGWDLAALVAEYEERWQEHQRRSAA